MHDLEALRLALAAVYALGALLALIAGLRARSAERGFWLFAALTLAALAAGKGLHLPDMLIGVRRAAKAEGWYSERREAQAAFALMLTFVMLGSAAILARRLRASPTTVKVAAAALLLLLAFVLLRAASLHAVDQWTMASLAGMRRGWWVELAVALVICAAAASSAAAPRRAAVWN